MQGSLIVESAATCCIVLLQVIYHLNVKNEDHEMDLAELSDQYEAEAENILKDAADKVNFFKNQLEEQRESQRAADVAKVRHQHGRCCDR